MVAYDDLYSIEYFHRALQALLAPQWNGHRADCSQGGTRNTSLIRTRCEQFDRAMMDDLRKAGGEEYAAALRAGIPADDAAHKLMADLDGTPLFFSKENFSNGCIETVDVMYPSSPFFLLFNPGLLERRNCSRFSNTRSLSRWKFPFAPHDLGTYPLANGQVYGGGEASEENQMPVEESGNMLLMVAAAGGDRRQRAVTRRDIGRCSRNGRNI